MYKHHSTLELHLGHIAITLRDMLVYKKSGIWYSITCRDCEKVYVGQTGCSVDQRITEHKRALASLDYNISAVAEHVIKTNIVRRILRFWTINSN